MSSIRLRFAILAAVMAAAVTVVGAQSQGDDAFRFKSGVELVNVTATVTDDNGHFVSGLTKEDFTVYEDGEQQEITQFSNERVPVSLGILLDTSGSMTPEKMSAARSAIDRFIYDLLGKDDELFFMQFAKRARPAAGMDVRPPRDQPRGRPGDGGRRHRDVRRDRATRCRSRRTAATRRRRSSSSRTATTPTAGRR